ncbi:Inositol transporter 4 [Dichanthelium oligosanthes]|uniref:Inositol transporter 4 n=1 Tax=Dichanthelium oligosanthes TaxID=888268 RepID=A0A1E5VZB1_9POAL|nr:Inositol transporter 4 [Dichanthelium oligosanthes]
MEGGIHKAESTEFRDLLYLTSKQPFILRLAFSAGIGGLLFGYDTGVISGALLYIRDDFEEVEKSTVMQETIVSMAVAGAIVGAGAGGWLNDRFGRRPSILIADLLFLAGSMVMCFAPTPAIIIVGRVLVGLGVGMASMTSPLYISEASPARIRGALVSTNGLLITAGQFLSYLINLAFTKAPGTWRWMLGVAGVPALVQFVLMLALPESPRWLYRKDRKREAEEIMRKVYPPEEVEAEIEALRVSVEADMAQERSLGGAGLAGTLRKAFGSVVVRRGLTAGVLCQVAQQLVGINTVMYYSPTIVQLAGFASNSTALALSLVTSGLNAAGSVVSMFFVDKAGRRKLMLLSLTGIVVCLAMLSGVFFAVDSHSPDVSLAGTALFGANGTCPDFALASAAGAEWTCTQCLRAPSECGFCADTDKLLPGACLTASDAARRACRAAGRREWYTRGCPSSFGWLALVALGAYIVSYSPGMGSVPWLINSEVYPLRFRGVCGGIAAVANWTSNLLVTQTFLSLTQALGTAGTFMLFCGVSAASFLLLFLLVPETKGLQFEEVEQMLGSKDYKAWKKFNPKA